MQHIIDSVKFHFHMFVHLCKNGIYAQCWLHGCVDEFLSPRTYICIMHVAGSTMQTVAVAIPQGTYYNGVLTIYYSSIRDSQN